MGGIDIPVGHPSDIGGTPVGVAPCRNREEPPVETLTGVETHRCPLRRAAPIGYVTQALELNLSHEP